MIKCVIFDFGGVCTIHRHSDHTWRDMWKGDRKILGKGFPYKTFYDQQRLLDSGKISLRKSWKAKFAAAGLANHELLKSLSLFKPKVGHVHKINKKIEKLVVKLKRNGYLVILCSNTLKIDNDFKKKMGYYKKFDRRFVSCELGFGKESDRIYKHILRKLKLKGSECVMIDDDPDFLIGARKAGIKTILYRNPSQLENYLSNLGLKF